MGDEEETPIKIIEFEHIPIDEAYSRDKLQGVSVPDETLEEFTRFFLWLKEEKGIDAEAEGYTLIYIDDDLNTIPNYWIFADLPESKEKYIEIIQDSNTIYPSSKDMVAFLNELTEKYPVKRINTGNVDFITVENKEVLLSELSLKDKLMFLTIGTIILEDSHKNRSELNDPANNSNDRSIDVPGFGISSLIFGILISLMCFKWTQRWRM